MINIDNSDFNSDTKQENCLPVFPVIIYAELSKLASASFFFMVHDVMVILI